MASASRALLLSRALHAGGAASRSVRPLAAAACLLSARAAAAAPGAWVRCFASQPATSSLPDSSQNWSKCSSPTNETIALDGCDFEHWLVVMEPPPGDASNPDIARDQIIDSYIKTLAQVVGSEEEARQKIYSVSTRHYFAFGAVVSEELANTLKEFSKVRMVLPDSYVDVKNKDYGGEPFINGEAVPYDPKYHEEWVRNNARARCKGSDLDDGSDSNDGNDSDVQGNGSDSNDQGDGSDSNDGSDSDYSSDSDDQGDGSDSDDGNDSDNKSDSNNRSQAKEATQMTKAKEETQTTEVTRTTRTTGATQTTKTKEATQTTRTTQVTRTTEATRTTKATEMTRTTEATRTTKVKGATQTTRTTEATRTTETTRTTIAK